jgi:hypothetical protein
MDLTVELKKLQGNRLTTLYQNKPFEIIQVANNQIILKTATEQQHTIPLKEITNAWNHLQRNKKITSSGVRDLGGSESNHAFIVAILANLPGVKHKLGPIVLTLPEITTSG